MPLSFTLVSSAADNADLSSYRIPVTGDLTPVSGSLYYLYIHNTKLDPVSTPTITGAGGWNVTWTQEGTATINDIRTTLFSGVASSNVAGFLTATLNVVHTSLGWSLIRVSGNAATGYSVQTVAAAATADTSLTLTLAAFSSANNHHLGEVGINRTDTITPSAGFTEISNVSWTLPLSRLESANKINQPEGVWSFGDLVDGSGVSVEVKAEVVAGQQSYQPHYQRGPILAQ